MCDLRFTVGSFTARRLASVHEAGRSSEKVLSSAKFRASVVLSAIGLVLVRVPARAIAQAEHRPGTAIQYRLEQVADAGRNLGSRFTASQLAILEKLNRADAAHLGELDYLVVPSVWYADEQQYSPFPLSYPAASGLSKLVLVDQAAQAFAAYGQGRLLRWGPVSSGRRAHPTPSGLFHLNWRSRGRHSSVNPQWYMEWYFNFDTVRGLALHSYTLPGSPASHACVRLLERDAIWIYDWGDRWTLGRRGQVLERGTPLLIVGHYGFDAQPPWRSLEHLARGIDLPEAPLPNHIKHGLMDETVGRDQPGIAQ